MPSAPEISSAVKKGFSSILVIEFVLVSNRMSCASGFSDVSQPLHHWSWFQLVDAVLKMNPPPAPCDNTSADASVKLILTPYTSLMSTPSGRMSATLSMTLPSLLAPSQAANALTASEETATAAAATLAKVLVNFIGFVLHKNILAV